MQYTKINDLRTKYINRFISRKHKYPHKIVFTLCVIGFFAYFAVNNISKANISISLTILDFLPKDSRQKNIELGNNKKDMSYIKSEVSEILNPGMPNQKRIPITRKNRGKLIISPLQLTMKPNERKIIRFISTEKNLKKDSVFRTTIVPLIKPKKDQQGIGINVLIGYEVLTIIRPKNMIFDLNITRNIKRNTITYKNNGNTNILLNKVVQCDEYGIDCQTLAHKRLYAGNTYTVSLPYYGAKITNEIQYANKTKRIVSEEVPHNFDKKHLIHNHRLKH